MQLPSKELLSEVLGGSDIEEIYIISDTLIFKYSHFINGHFQYKRKTEINIHELAYKCTEWAFDKGYLICVWEERVFGYYSEDTRKFVTFNYTGEILSNSIDVKDIKFTYKFETEQEYIFQACQWILDNKDN